MIRNIVLVALGGGIGSVARYLCQKWAYSIYPHHFPWGTLVVNVIGSLVIGLLWGISFKSFESNESWKLFLMVGLCGGFTTFSAYSLEGLALIEQQRYTTFFLYFTGSVVLGLAATFLGALVTK